VQAQFGHLGKLKHFRIFVHRGKLKVFGHQTQTAAARKTLVATLKSIIIQKLSI